MTAWPLQPLGQVAEIERHTTQPDQIAPGTAYLGLEHIATGGEILGAEPARAGLLRSTKFRFTAGHILYGKLRPYLGKIAAPDFDGICSTEIIPLRPGPAIDRRFLLHFLRQPAQVELATARSAGANLPRLSPTELADVRVPVPALPEQRRIAAILDGAGALRAKRRAALAQLDEMAQAIFVEMFGDPTTNPKAWPVRQMREVGQVVTGNTPSRAVAENYGGDIEWIKSDNLGTLSYYATEAEEHLSPLGLKLGRTASAGAILVTCIAGSPNVIGNSAMLDRNAAFNQQINALIPVKINPHFAYAYLKVGKSLVQAESTASMKGMVSKSRFERIRFMVPPRPMQDDFADHVLRILDLRCNAVAAQTAAEALFASLQHRAFTGAL